MEEIKRNVIKKEKLMKFVRKPLLILSSCILAFFLLAVIITSAVPVAHSTYRYKENYFGVVLDIEVSFEDDEATLIITQSNDPDVTYEEFEYTIKNGYLLTMNGSTVEKVGKINAYKLDVEIPADYLGYPLTITLKCGLTNAMLAVDIVMIVLSAIGIGTSLTFSYLDKKKANKQQDLENNKGAEENENQ